MYNTSMYKLNLQSKVTFRQLLIYAIFFALVILCALHNRISEDYIVFGIILLPFIVRSYLDSKTYVSYIEIYNSYIIIVYKEKDKIIKRLKIKKNDIENFQVDIWITETSDGHIINCKTNAIIKKKDGSEITFLNKFGQYDLSNLFKPVHSIAINWVKARKQLPGFSYKVFGSEYVKRELMLIESQNRTFSFKERISNQFETGSDSAKIRIIVGLAGMILPFIILLAFMLCIFIQDFTRQMH